MGCSWTQLRRATGGGGGNFDSNVFKVYNVDKEGVYRNPGKIEITDTELIFHHKNKEPIHWPLRYLRRYGFDSELFSFESGRRCPTGQGIYAFKCSRAEALFNLLQDSIARAGQSDDLPVSTNARPMTSHSQAGDQLHHPPELQPINAAAGARTRHTQTNGFLSNHSSTNAANGVIPLTDFPQIANSQHEYINSNNVHVAPSSATDGLSPSRIELRQQVSFESEPEPQIQYAQLDLDGGGSAQAPPLVADGDGDAAHLSYINVPPSGGGGGGMKLSSSVPLIEAPGLPSVQEEPHLNNGRQADNYLVATTTATGGAATPAPKQMTYAEVDFTTSNAGDSTPNAMGDKSRGVNTNGHVRRQSDVSQTSSAPIGATPTPNNYAQIDHKKTLALLQMNTGRATEDDESARKTRHNSTIDFQH